MQSYFNQVTENLGEENFEKTLNTKKLQWFDHVTIVFGTVLSLNAKCAKEEFSLW